jgi:hypothetical protein
VVERGSDALDERLAMPSVGARGSSGRANEEIVVFVRVVRFTDVTPERMQSLEGRIDETGPPPGVPIKKLQVVFDEAQGTAVVLQFFDDEASLRTGAETFAAMDPSETPGSRASVDTGELRVEREV